MYGINFPLHVEQGTTNVFLAKDATGAVIFEKHSNDNLPELDEQMMDWIVRKLNLSIRLN